MPDVLFEGRPATSAATAGPTAAVCNQQGVTCQRGCWPLQRLSHRLGEARRCTSDLKLFLGSSLGPKASKDGEGAEPAPGRGAEVQKSSSSSSSQGPSQLVGTPGSGSSASSPTEPALFVGSDKKSIFLKGRDAALGAYLAWGEGSSDNIAVQCFLHKNCKRSYSQLLSSIVCHKFAVRLRLSHLCPP